MAAICARGFPCHRSCADLVFFGRSLRISLCLVSQCVRRSCVHSRWFITQVHETLKPLTAKERRAFKRKMLQKGKMDVSNTIPTHTRIHTYSHTGHTRRYVRTDCSKLFISSRLHTLLHQVRVCKFSTQLGLHFHPHAIRIQSYFARDTHKTLTFFVRVHMLAFSVHFWHSLLRFACADWRN